MLRVDLLGVVEDVGDVAAGLGHLCGEPQLTATPLFMSMVPRPHSTLRRRSTRQAAGCRLSGTVSMWPASTTRSARPRSVRATTVLPSGHLEVRELAQRGLHRIRERAFVALTDSMSHSATVSAATSVVRSRAVVVDGIPVSVVTGCPPLRWSA